MSDHRLALAITVLRGMYRDLLVAQEHERATIQSEINALKGRILKARGQ